MTHGLIRAGFHVLAGVDNALQCETTYSQNKNSDGTRPEYICKDIFPKSKEHPTGQQQDIAARLETLICEYKRRYGYRTLRLVFAICAPCQPFTKITKIQMSDRRKFKRSNDSNLLLTTSELIRKFRPDAIICENVEGIVEGSGSVLTSFKRSLTRNGYKFDAKVVNAANFGVPQNRKRTIGIGFDRLRYDFEFDVLERNPGLKRYIMVFPRF